MNPFARRTYGTLARVTERVYLFRNIVNSVIVLGDKASAVIDTQVNAPMAERLVQQVRTLSDKPLRYAINTHYHWDHTAGNHVCKRAGATVVSSALTRTFMATRSARQQAFLASRGFELGPAPYLADATVTEPHTLDLGNQRLCLMHLGKAESDDALVIHLPQEGCVVAGDTVMTGSFPMFGQPVMNEGLMGTTDWLETLQAIERLQPVHVLPGHGPIAHAQELALLKRLERYFLEEVAARVARDMPLPALLADLESQLPAWITAIPVVWGHRAMPFCGCIGAWWTTRLVNRGGSTSNLRPYQPATRHRCRQPVRRSQTYGPFRRSPRNVKRVAIWAVPLRSPATPRSGPPSQPRGCFWRSAWCVARGAWSVC